MLLKREPNKLTLMLLPLLPELEEPPDLDIVLNAKVLKTVPPPGTASLVWLPPLLPPPPPPPLIDAGPEPPKELEVTSLPTSEAPDTNVAVVVEYEFPTLEEE